MFDLLLRFSFLVVFPTDNKFALFNLAQSLLLLIKQNKANNWNWLKKPLQAIFKYLSVVY